LVIWKVFKQQLKSALSEYCQNTSSKHWWKTLQASTEKHFKKVHKNIKREYWKTQSPIHYKCIFFFRSCNSNVLKTHNLLVYLFKRHVSRVLVNEVVQVRQVAGIRGDDLEEVWREELGEVPQQLGEFPPRLNAPHLICRQICIICWKTKNVFVGELLTKNKLILRNKRKLLFLNSEFLVKKIIYVFFIGNKFKPESMTASLSMSLSSNTSFCCPSGSSPSSPMSPWPPTLVSSRTAARLAASAFFLALCECSVKDVSLSLMFCKSKLSYSPRSLKHSSECFTHKKYW